MLVSGRAFFIPNKSWKKNNDLFNLLSTVKKRRLRFAFSVGSWLVDSVDGPRQNGFLIVAWVDFVDKNRLEIFEQLEAQKSWTR